MRIQLLVKALAAFAAGFVLVGLLVFLSAGTLRYPCGWLFCGVLFIPMLLMGIVLFIKNPALLQKRLMHKETQSEQKKVVLLSILMFLAGFILCGLDFRFQWLQLPKWISFLAAVIFLIGYLMYAEVLRENAYLSRTVKVEEGQKVVSTGLYGIVRHPMYMTTVIMFLSMPLVLGSPISFMIMLGYIPVIAKRIWNEEIVLSEGLDGYKEYMKRVKYKVIPFIW